MQKKYRVRLSDEERHHLKEVIKKQKGSGQKVRRAQILLKADADGPGWTDREIAEAFTSTGSAQVCAVLKRWKIYDKGLLNRGLKRR